MKVTKVFKPCSTEIVALDVHEEMMDAQIVVEMVCLKESKKVLKVHLRSDVVFSVTFC